MTFYWGPRQIRRVPLIAHKFGISLAWGHLANNVNIIMITRSRSFFYSVNLAVQKVKTRERTNTAINISQRWIIPVPQSTVLCRNTDLPSYYHSFVAVTGVNPLLQWRGGPNRTKGHTCPTGPTGTAMYWMFQHPRTCNVPAFFLSGTKSPYRNLPAYEYPPAFIYCWSAPYLTL